jgi:hypothetical protein
MLCGKILHHALLVLVKQLTVSINHEVGVDKCICSITTSQSVQLHCRATAATSAAAAATITATIAAAGCVCRLYTARLYGQDLVQLICVTREVKA